MIGPVMNLKQDHRCDVIGSTLQMRKVEIQGDLTYVSVKFTQFKSFVITEFLGVSSSKYFHRKNETKKVYDRGNEGSLALGVRPLEVGGMALSRNCLYSWASLGQTPGALFLS